jgi:hypothetical protein
MRLPGPKNSKNWQNLHRVAKLGLAIGCCEMGSPFSCSCSCSCSCSKGKAPHLSQDSDEKGLFSHSDVLEQKGRFEHDTIEKAAHEDSEEERHRSVYAQARISSTSRNTISQQALASPERIPPWPKLTFLAVQVPCYVRIAPVRHTQRGLRRFASAAKVLLS